MLVTRLPPAAAPVRSAWLAARQRCLRRRRSSSSDSQQRAAAPAAQATRTVLVVAVALVDAQRRVLLAQRPAGKAMAGLWEFPGGKIDPGETPEAALVRELHEELDIQVEARDLRPLTFASHAYDGFHLLMPLYVCSRWAGALSERGAEGQALAWATARSLRDYAMPAADVPLLPAVLRALRGDR